MTRAMREVNRRRQAYMNPDKRKADELATDNGKAPKKESSTSDQAKKPTERLRLPPIHNGTEQETETEQPTESLETIKQRALDEVGDVDNVPDMEDDEVDDILAWANGLEDETQLLLSDFDDD